MTCGVMTPGMNISLNGSCEPTEIQPVARTCLDKRGHVCGTMSAQQFVVEIDMSFACEAVQSNWILYLWVGGRMDASGMTQVRHVV